MKMTLTERFDNTVVVNGETLDVDLSFDNVLRIFELFTDDDFAPHERVEISVDMLIGENTEINFSQKDLILYKVFKEYLGVDLKELPEPSLNTEKYFDMYSDSEMIYAAFMKNYNIDLFEQHGILHFRKFSALLNQLLDRNLKEVVGIRAQELPKSTKYNAEERKHVAKLKKLYKLDGIEEKPEVVTEQIDSVFDSLAEQFRPKKG